MEKNIEKEVKLLDNFDYEEHENLNYALPNDKEFLANKLINDIILSYLYLKSKHDPNENHRYVKKYRGFLSRMSRQLQMPKNTLTYHMQNLIRSGFIKEIECNTDSYYILPIPRARFTLIDQKTLYFLVRNFKIHLIKTYIYLKYLWNTKGNKKEIHFTLKDLGLILGYEESYLDNKYFIEGMREILYILKQVKLIEVTEVWHEKVKEDGTTVHYLSYKLCNCNDKVKISFKKEE